MPDSTSKFYGLAKSIADIVLHHSWEEAKLRDVLLYGSTLTELNPTDIDLLVLHSGGAYMENYTRSRSQLETGQEILYLSPSQMLGSMGHRENEAYEGVFLQEFADCLSLKGLSTEMENLTWKH